MIAGNTHSRRIRNSVKHGFTALQSSAILVIQEGIGLNMKAVKNDDPGTLCLCIGGPIDGQWRDWTREIEKEACQDDFQGNFKLHYYHGTKMVCGDRMTVVYRHEDFPPEFLLEELMNRYE